MIDKEQFTKMWQDPAISRLEIAEHFGIPKTSAQGIAVRMGLGSRRAYRKKRPADPSPSEIARLCEEIQSGWTERRFSRQMMARPRLYD